MAETIEYYFPHNDPSPKAVMTNKIALALNENPVTRPMSEYLLGIAMVFKRVDGGNGAYFMQKVSGKAFTAYFPTVFALKEPLPILFLMLLALSLGFVYIFKSDCKSPGEKNVLANFLRHRLTGLSMFAFIALYSYVSITGNLNIGFRHLFPILPFAYILTAKVIFDFIKRADEHNRKIWGIVLTGLVIFLAAKTVAAYPAYMSYFNEIAGGPKNGYQYATDSNADWGQDLKRLKIFVNRYNWCDGNDLDSFCKIYDKKRGPIGKIHLNYFGGADIKYYFGEQAIDWWDSRRPIEPGWYAISTNYLMGSIYDTTKKDNESYRWLKNIKPIAQVGTSIFVYYITSEDIKN
jgi:phosphatidylglycerophosphate synthase